MKILSKKDECFIHVVFWVLYVLYFNIEESKSLDSFSLNVKTISLFTVTWFIVVLSTFYFQYLVILPWVFDKAVWVRLFFSVLLVAAFFIVFRFFVEQQLSKWLFNAWNYPNSTNMYFYLYENAFYGIIVYFFCIVIWLIVRFVRLLQVSKAILEEKQKAEIKFLKAQINPHFVFNTLNNIYSMVHFGSDRSLSAIEKLSNIMRFTTYEAQKDLILLEDEVEYIKSFIELEQLRLTDAETVKLEIVDTFNHVEIPPYLLSPLVENALKHGVKPIHIKLNVSDKELVFNVSNKIGSKKKDGYAGVGLENLRKRLEIYYSKKHVLNETVSEGVFHIELKIILG